MVRKKNIIAVISPKGGVGKTVTTVNLAVAIATKFNKKVLAVDTNLSTASLALHLNLFYPKVTLNDVLDKKAVLKKAIYVYGKNLHILPASIKIKKRERNLKNLRLNMQKIVNKYEKLLESLSEEYDLILLDCAPGFDLETLAAMHVAGGIILVTNPDFPAIATITKALEYALFLKIPVGGIVLNKVTNRKYELKQKDIEDLLKIKVLEKIPFDKRIPESIANKIPVVIFKPRSKSGKAYYRLAASLMGEEKKPNIFKRIHNSFKSKLKK